MVHFNESWDLPPLVGSCYMYGPQQTAEVTAADVWRLLKLRARRDNLQKALDLVFEIGAEVVMSPQLGQQPQAARLDSCCALLRQAIKVMNEEISEARGAGKFSYLLDET